MTAQPGPAHDPGWDRQVWRLAGPIIVSNATVPLLGAVDTAVVGHLPAPHYIGAVALGAVIFNFVFWGFGFLRMGTTGLVAQAFGADDGDELRAILARAMLLAGVLGLAAIALQDVVALVAFGLVEASAEVEAHADSYLHIRIWAAPAALGNYVLIGWFIGMQRAGRTVAVQIAINAVNILLDLVFVLGLDLGVEGVAMASVIAEYGGLLLGLVLMRRLVRGMPGRLPRGRVMDPGRLKQLVSINVDIFIRTLALITSFAYVTAKGAAFGDTVLAANAVLMHFQNFTAFAFDGFAHAAEALVGRTVGRRSRAQYRAAVMTATRWAAIVAVVFALAWLVAGPAIIGMMTGLESVRETAMVFLPWLIVSPLVSVWSYMLDGVFIGATRTAELRNAMLACLVVCIGAGELMTPVFGNHGLWAAVTLFMIARAATLGLYLPRIARAIESAPVPPKFRPMS